MSVEALIDALERLDAEHRAMLQWAEAKRSAIVDNNVDELVSIMTHESRVLKRIEQLEEERVEVCQAFLREKGIKSRLNLTITELSRLVFDPGEKQRLADMQHKLNDTLNELKRVNDLNQKLIEQSLAFLDYSLDLLVGPPEDDATYRHPGERSSGTNRPGLFDTRA